MQQPNQRYPGQGELQSISVPNSGIPSSQSYPVTTSYTPTPVTQSPYASDPRQYSYSSQSSCRPSGSYYTGAAPSPSSSIGTVYYSNEKLGSMAAATLQRAPYPPSYYTPQTASPTSVSSPHVYQQAGQMPHSIYYGHPQSNPMNASAYSPYTNASINPGSIVPGSYNSSSVSLPQMSSVAAAKASPRMKTESGQQYGIKNESGSQYSVIPRQRPSLASQHQNPTAVPIPGSILPKQETSLPQTSSAAPGPIPATTPLVVRQDGNGVQWIAFEYSRDRVKMEYTIRCDVESVDVNSLPAEFKAENCVYPRACVPRDQYKGNRLAYETECNQVGWGLAELNTCLRGKRGLIQRAVDSWRNSNQDPRLRSRRVRRQSKLHSKQKSQSQDNTHQSSGPHAMGMSNTTKALSSAASTALPSGTSHHHHSQTGSSPLLHDRTGSFANPSMYRSQPSTQQYSSSPHDVRQAHNFSYQSYPSNVPTQSSMAPPINSSIMQYGRTNEYTTTASQQLQEVQNDSVLFGQLPDSKKRKFILVDDTQKNTKVRVRVSLHEVDVKEIPDSYRKNNSVFPRSFNPLIDDPPVLSPRFTQVDDGQDEGPPTVGRTTVPTTLIDDDAQIEVSKLTRRKRARELSLNELGYRMAWAQSRVFSNRPIFLGRALDAYRNKQRGALLANGQDSSALPSHLERRPGKRRWLERTRSAAHTSPTSVSEQYT